MNKIIESDEFDIKNATLVAEWYRAVMVERGYEVNFRLDDMVLIDRYCENVLWKMDQSTELFFKENEAFFAYIGETIVRNSKAVWIGEFDLYNYGANYYTSRVGFVDGYRVTPGILAYRVSNRSKDELIEQSTRSVVEKMNEIQPV